ncbi:BrnT family toxin [Roseiarcus sp.]|uniref:BrnT family toxin n=1 Tax=Roseiarcus sp. TaxID=1969460 RepID=UPI003D0ED935
MRFSFDADKRAATLEKRGIDMLDAAKVFAGPTATWLDDRFNYGEARWLTAGFLAGRVVLIAWTHPAA